ncbi:hypothetical protein ACP70R_031255 [Stipagrostis hirtigluma subsp. patula]
MQLVSCEFAAAAGRPGAAVVWSGRRPPLPTVALRKKPPAASPSSSTVRASASRRDDAEFGCGGGGRMVDEGMVVLRRRIHEMRAAERNWEPPAEWAAWEKEWYGTYDADVCNLAGALRAFLVGCRPGVGVGLLAVLLLSVPASAFILVSHLLDASNAIVSKLHP